MPCMYIKASYGRAYALLYMGGKDTIVNINGFQCQQMDHGRHGSAALLLMIIKL